MVAAKPFNFGVRGETREIQNANDRVVLDDMNEMNACMKMHGMNLSRQIIEKNSNKNISSDANYNLLLKIQPFVFDLRFKKQIAFSQ